VQGEIDKEKKERKKRTPQGQRTRTERTTAPILVEQLPLSWWNNCPYLGGKMNVRREGKATCSPRPYQMKEKMK
jgi:hypothetical protein